MLVLGSGDGESSFGDNDGNTEGDPASGEVAAELVTEFVDVNDGNL